MKPGTWTEHGAVLTSEPGDVYNAIDPNIIDAHGLKFTFGSYWQGMYQVDLKNATTKASSPPGRHMAGTNGRPAEGGFVYQPKLSPYYYYFFSYGITPLVGATSRPDEGAEYRVLVGRGKSAEGPFHDKDGHELTEDIDPPAGSLVLGSHDNIYAPGGQAVIHDPLSGRDVMVYHYVPNDAEVGGPSYLGINYLDFSNASASNSLGTSPEAAWGMTPTDWSSQSKIPLRVDWKHSYERALWTLIPSDEVLSTILQRLLMLRSRGFNSSWSVVLPPGETYRYTFVPLALEGITITRQPYTARPTRQPVAPNVYLPPYTGFPELACAAHPYIAILAAVAHLRQHEQKLSPEQLQAYSMMEHIRSLWIQLSSKIIDDSVLPSIETPKGNANGSDDSTNTRVKRPRTSSPA
ncbi:unnamed protein product [Peniophora sp. CBMAI 1063]|nr:unnamed protein product [Peniophora sp. CBMAI 1063]